MGDSMARQNKCRKLADLLKYQITSGKIREGEQLEAITRLAERHETTVATISKALELLEGQGFIERIAGKGVFVKKRVGTRIAVVFDRALFSGDGMFSFQPIFLNEFDRCCQERKWSYELFFNVCDENSARNFLSKLENGMFDAVFIGSLYVAENYEKIFSNISLFTVGIYSYKELPFAIYFDIYRMIYDAVLELDRLGCREIALFDMNKPNQWSSIPDLSARAYRDALKRTGRLDNTAYHYRLELSQQGGNDGFMSFISKERHSGKLGIICTDSCITMGVIQAALSHHFKIPEEIVIASHANQGCNSAQFTIPVILYEYRIGEHIGRICDRLEEYLSGGTPPFGLDSMEPVRLTTGSASSSKVTTA